MSQSGPQLPIQFEESLRQSGSKSEAKNRGPQCWDEGGVLG